jgi:amidohydrolase
VSAAHIASADARSDREAVKDRLAALVMEHRDRILDVSHRIHADPELAFEERHAAALVASVIAEHGYAVERPAGRLQTAVRGRLAGGLGVSGPRVAILAEYDALPGVGHGCGHNTMAASGVGAAIALAGVVDLIAGEIVFLGTPAEERGSGKRIMLEDGLFDGIDAALLFHPCDRDHVECWALASEDVEVTFTGQAAHAAFDPWRGRNALDALVLLFSSIALWRQQLPPSARVHGIVVEGGDAPNVIPDRTVGRFMVRGSDQAEFQAVRERFRDLVAASALATACQGDVVFSGGSTTFRHNRTLAQVFGANMAAADIADQGPDPHVGSTDMGNVSQALPTIHPDLAIAPVGTPSHSPEFRDAAASGRADEVTLMAATLVAQTAWDLFADPGIVEAAWREHRGG